MIPEHFTRTRAVGVKAQELYQQFSAALFDSAGIRIESNDLRLPLDQEVSLKAQGIEVHTTTIGKFVEAIAEKMGLGLDELKRQRIVADGNLDLRTLRTLGQFKGEVATSQALS